jgi:hypothetical protein
MSAGLALLLLLAPDDPAQILRVAWASQYEWKEDKVQNATIEFRWTHTWGERGEFTREGQGQIVVVGDDVVRRHYPEANDDETRRRIDEHVLWVLGRFVRRPFEEAFKGVKFSGPEKSAYDSLKITAGPRVYYVKDDRFVAEERNVGLPERPFLARVDFTTADVGGGYAIVGESLSFTRATDGVKVTRERSLTTRAEGDRPVPALYAYDEKSAREKEHWTLDFHTVRFDLADPVVLDPAARDLLKAAWARRHVLPNDIRIQGEFQRTVDRDLDRARWRGDVHGDFQVWGMDSLQIEIDEGGQETEQTCRDHIRWIFDLLRDTPFDEEFKGCGFQLESSGSDTVVRVYGYAKAAAFRIADGAIAGHYDRVLSEWGWWEYRTKAMGDGRLQIDRMRRELEGKKIDLEFSYQRARGALIPKKCGALGLPRTLRGDIAVGVAEYTFKKAKVSFASDKE